MLIRNISTILATVWCTLLQSVTLGQSYFIMLRTDSTIENRTDTQGNFNASYFRIWYTRHNLNYRMLRVGARTDLLQLSDMLDFEGSETPGKLIFLIFCWACISIYLFININQLDALNFIISLLQASTCFEHMFSSSGGQNCIIQSLVSSHL